MKNPRLSPKFLLLASATSIFIFASPAAAADECGAPPPAGGTVTCTTAGNPYPNGIFYIAPANLTINLLDGVVIDTAGSLNPGILAIAGTQDATINVNGVTNTTISTTDSGAFGALIATNSGVLGVALDRVTTTGDNASGILASSSEGAITVSANNIATSGNSASGVDANTNISNVTIDVGTITTAGTNANGITARSDSADLNITTDNITTGFTAGVSSSGSNGIQANTGRNGQIIVDSGIISTVGDGAAGIRATNGTGVVSIASDQIKTTGSTADGITVSSRGAVGIDGGIIRTTGATSNGIQVQASGGATIGYGSVMTAGANSVGILVPQGALFFGPLFTPTVSIIGGNVATTGSGSDAIRAFASTGPVTLGINGTVSTTGDNSRGIVANAATGVMLTGNTNVSTIGANANAVDITSTTGPINLNFGSGAVSATGLGSFGINTNSTTGPQTISVNGVTANADAIQAVASGAGPIIINANNDVTSATGIGIDVATGGTSTINVAAGAPVTGQTLGINSVATGGTIVNLRAPVVGTTGLEINLDGGASTINNFAGNSLTGAVNFTDANDQFNNSGTFTPVGTTDFGLGSDLFANLSGGTLNLTQNATFTGLELLTNAGSINAVGTTTFGGTTLNNGGTFTTTGATTLGGLAAFNNSGLLVLAPGTFTTSGPFANSGTVRAEGGATSIAGQSNFANSGAIDLQDGATGDFLTIASPYVGSGPASLSIDASGAASDRLIVTGATTSGSTLVNVNLLGFGTIDPVGQLVVDNVASTPNAFTLGTVNNSPLLAYSLEQRGADYFLTAAPTIAAFQPLSLAAAASDMWYQSADEVISQIRLPYNNDGFAVWGQIYASRDKFNGNNDTVTLNGVDYDVNNNAKNHRYGAQAGVDFGFGGGRVGLTGGYAKNKVSSAADLKIKGWNAGVYGQFGGVTGFHGEALVKYDRYKVDVRDGAFAGDNSKLRELGVDGALGYRFGLGSANLDLNAGLAHVRSKLGGIDNFGFSYDYSKITSTRGRAGVRAVFGTTGWRPYVDATVLHEFDGKARVNLFDGTNNYDLNYSGKGTWARLEAGVGGPSSGAGPILAAWADVGDKKGVGVRLGFRFGAGHEEMAPPPPPPPAPPPPPPPTQTCADGAVILATDVCPPPPPPPPPPPEPERG
ncbi:MAG: hypothetical protein ABIR87_04995 [Sphingomicrobium sp.]